MMQHLECITLLLMFLMKDMKLQKELEINHFLPFSRALAK